MRWLRSLFSLSPASLTLGTICVVVVLFVCGIPLLDLDTLLRPQTKTEAAIQTARRRFTNIGRRNVYN